MRRTARTGDDFIIRADVPDLQVAPYMGALRWLVHRAMARTQGNLAAAARLLQVNRNALSSWLKANTAVTVPLDLMDRFVWSGTVREDQYFRDAQFFLAISAHMGIGDLIQKVPQLVKISTPDDIHLLIQHALGGVTIP